MSIVRYTLGSNFAVVLLSAMVGCGGESATAPISTGAVPASVPAAGSDEASPNVASPTATSSTPETSPATFDSSHPRVKLTTSEGAIVVELDAENAPLTVRNFLAYTSAGHFDGTIFHQAVKDFIVVGGGYDPQLNEKAAQFPIRNEADNGLRNEKGTIAMARQPDVVDSSTCQFFFNLANNTSLDHRGDSADEYGYCVFGRIVEGADVLDRIANATVSTQKEMASVPVKPIMITSAVQVH